MRNEVHSRRRLFRFDVDDIFYISTYICTYMYKYLRWKIQIRKISMSNQEPIKLFITSSTFTLVIVVCLPII